MPNHTPEEWFADDGRDGTEQSWCLITDNGGLVAQRLYREDAEYIVKCLRDLKQAIELLRDASERLQDYCAQVRRHERLAGIEDRRVPRPRPTQALS